MDDETFERIFGSAPKAETLTQSRTLQESTEKRSANRRWIGWAVAAFLVLGIIGAVSSDPDHRRSGAASTDTQAANTAYTRPTLHDKTAIDWQTGSYDDKLATCTFFLWGLWEHNAFKPHIQNSIHSIEELKPYAREIVVCIDAATRPVPDPVENRRVFGGLKVHEIAAAGVVTMGWGR